MAQKVHTAQQRLQECKAWRLRATFGESWLTTKWRQTVHRFSILSPLDVATLGHVLESARKTFKWKYSTTATYCSAVLTARKFLHPQKSMKPFSSLATFLESQARCEKKEKAPPMRRRHARKLAEDMQLHRSPLEVAILLAWIYGQRISDVCRLHSDDCRKIRLGGHRFLVLTVRRGKTTKNTGPYTIHIPTRGSPLAKWILDLASGKFLFTGQKEDTKQTRARMARKVRVAMKMISPRLEARSIRRGGLQQLANMGLSLPEIQLYFSQHKTIRVLREYLDYGTHDVTQANSHSTRLNSFPWMEND
jgi:hypothetical protein